jgi:DNA mismatch repair protein MSH5
MQVMFTSSAGEVLEPNNFCVNAGFGGTSIDGDGHEDRNIIGPGEKITYLYRSFLFFSHIMCLSDILLLFSRVANGLSLGSHAANCAEICGVPKRMVKRAQYVSQLLVNHELGRLLDEGMNEEERLDLVEAEEVCRRFLRWDLKDEAEREDGRVKVKLGHVLGRVSNEMDSAGNETTNSH